jgi:hypothetical protein
LATTDFFITLKNMQASLQIPKETSTMFCKLNMETGIVKTEIPLEKVQDTITKATALAAKATFSWVPLSRPDGTHQHIHQSHNALILYTEGFTMLFYTPAQQADVPNDGYQWLDQEVVRGIMMPDGRVY